MVKVFEETLGCAFRGCARECEDLAIDVAPSRASAQAIIPNLPVPGETFQPITVPTTVPIRLNTESLIKRARNDDEKLAIIAAINRFYLIALLGVTDRRCAC
jgi:hypothetical protein